MLQFALLQSALSILSLHMSLIITPSLSPQTVHTLEPEGIPRSLIHVLQSDGSVIPHGLDHSQARLLCAQAVKQLANCYFYCLNSFPFSIPIFESIFCTSFIFLYYIKHRFSTYISQFPSLYHINVRIK